MVAKYGCDDWKSIADQIGMKNRRIALIEFLRIKISKEGAKSNQYEQLDELEKQYLHLIGNSEEKKVYSMK